MRTFDWKKLLCAIPVVLVLVVPTRGQADPPAKTPRSSPQVCKGKFEFRYECLILYQGPQGPITVTTKDRHLVPFSVNFQKDPPSIEGAAEHSWVLTATGPNFQHTETNTDKDVLFGELIIGRSAKEQSEGSKPGEDDETKQGPGPAKQKQTGLNNVTDGKATNILSGLLAGTGQTLARIDIEKATNGDDADVPTGPVVTVGTPVTWTYAVTNAGTVPLHHLAVTDDKGESPLKYSGDPNANGVLDVGERWTYQTTGRAVEGQYKNIGTVTALTPRGEKVMDRDPSHYLGVQPVGQAHEDQPPTPSADPPKLKMGFVRTALRGGPPSTCGPWIFPLKDGYTRDFPEQWVLSGPTTVTITFTITLHLEECELNQEER
jgi:hypothetical protein